jgi:hypothetical protein
MISRRLVPAVLLALWALGGCADASRLGGPPPSGRANVIVPRAAVFMNQTGGTGPAFVNNVRVVLLRTDGSVAVDTVVTFAENLDELVISLAPQMSGSSETFAATVQLRNGDTVLLETSGPVTAVPANQPTPPPAPLPAPAPPGNAVLPSAVRILPADTTVFEGDSVAFRVTGLNGQAPLTSFTYTLTPRETDVRTTATGFVRTPLRRGGGWVVVRAPGAPPTVRDSAFLRFQPRPTGLQIVSGNNQSATILTALPAPLVARVVGRDGLGVSGVTVAFTPPAGAGYAVGTTTAVSDASGLVQTTATVGSVAQAANFRVSIGSTTITADFSATGTPGAPVALRFTQAPSATQRAVSPFEVRVRGADVGGNTTDLPAATSVTVAAEVAGAALATFNGGSAASATGTAVFASRTVSRAVTAVQLVATAAGLTAARSVAFDVVTGPAASLAKIAGDAQALTVGQAAPVLPRVRVVDDLGAPVGGVSVAFAAASASGTLTGGAATSNADGEASPTAWTLGTVAGPQSVTATVGTLPVQTFAATATAGPATQLLADAGGANTGTVATAVTPLPRAKVADAFGNAVSGVAVTFRTQANRGTITDSVRTTDAAGLATLGSWLAGQTAGSDTVLASTATPVLGPVRFIVTLAAGAPAAIVKTLGDAQNGVPSAALPDTLAVRVNDAFGNPVSGVTVTFTVAGGGSLTRSTAVTDTAGRAGPQTWTLGASGTQTVTATVGTLTATFTALLGAGIPTTITLANTGAATGVVGALRQGIAATVLDGAGSPVANTAVRLRPASARSGTIVFGDSTATTDANGVATFAGQWRLDTLPGVDTLRAVSVVQPTAVAQTIVTSVAGPPYYILDRGNVYQVVRAGQVARPMTFEVTDQYRNALSGVPLLVSYRVTAGIDAYANQVDATVTAANGRYILSGWTPVAPDTTREVTVQVAAGCPNTFTYCPVVYGVASRVFDPSVVVPLDTLWSKSGAVGTTVVVPIRFYVGDRNFTGVPGASVIATISTPEVVGPDTVARQTRIVTLTASDSGTVTFTHTFGSAPGRNEIVFDAGGVQLRYVLQGTGGLVGPALRVVVDTLGFQIADSGSTLGLPRARVVDANGNGVSGATVTWLRRAPGGTLGAFGTTVTTGAGGLAQPSVAWVLTNTPGYDRLVAVVGTDSLEFTSYGRSRPRALQPLLWPSATGFFSTSESFDLAVRVIDAGGFPVPNAAVSWTCSATTTCSAGPSPTGPDGVAGRTWAIGTSSGSFTLTATSGAVSVSRTITVFPPCI